MEKEKLYTQREYDRAYDAACAEVQQKLWFAALKNASLLAELAVANPNNCKQLAEASAVLINAVANLLQER